MSYEIEGLRITSIKFDALKNQLKNSNSEKKSVHFVAASTIVAVNQDKQLLEVMNSGILISDSYPLLKYLATRQGTFHGIRGTDFMRLYLSDGDQLYFLLGSTPKVTKALIEKIQTLNPAATCVGEINPSFTEDFKSEIKAWANVIINSGATSVWVGMGSPKQDIIAHLLTQEINVPILAVGAAFDFISGNKREAPRIIQKLYLEWLFRFLSEPKRLLKRYTLGNATFLRILILDVMKTYKKK